MKEQRAKQNAWFDITSVTYLFIHVTIAVKMMDVSDGILVREVLPH